LAYFIIEIEQNSKPRRLRRMLVCPWFARFSKTLRLATAWPQWNKRWFFLWESYILNYYSNFLFCSEKRMIPVNLLSLYKYWLHSANLQKMDSRLASAELYWIHKRTARH
jgi:hypothetical protein